MKFLCLAYGAEKDWKALTTSVYTVTQLVVVYAATAAASAMSRRNSGAQEPQLVPAFKRCPIAARSWQPLAIAASMALRPTPKQAHTVTPVSRPEFSGRLANTRARAMGVTMRPWQEALAQYLREKYSAGG